MLTFQFKNYTINLFFNKREYYYQGSYDLLNYCGYGDKDIIKLSKGRFKKDEMAADTDLMGNDINFLCHPKANLREILTFMSHELGHKIEGGFKKNPRYIIRLYPIHEAKANHYENFALDAYDLSLQILKRLPRK